MRYIVKHHLVFLWIAFIASSLVFVAFPQIDLIFSEHFYEPKNHFSFYPEWMKIYLHHSLKYVLFAVYTSAIALWLYNYVYKKNVLRFDSRKLLFVVIVGVVSSGLIVNLLLKEQWGRARPSEIVQFSGDKQFTPAFVLSDQGGHSFSCGHASGAFLMIAFAMQFYRYRRIAIAIAVVYGLMVSAARIIAGGHFLSDVFVSFFIVTIVTFTYNALIYKKSKRNDELYERERQIYAYLLNRSLYRKKIVLAERLKYKQTRGHYREPSPQ